MSSMAKSLFCLISVVAVVSASSLAMAGRSGPCAEDAKKLCPNAKGKELRECMQKNEAKVSAACKAQKEHAQKIVDACKGDAEKFCKDTKPGKGRVHACLTKNEAQLSSACRDAMKSAPAPGAGKGATN